MKTLSILICIVSFFIFQIETNKSLAFETNNLKEQKKDHHSYSEQVHMYIAIEALNLLKNRFPEKDFTIFDNKIGTMSDHGTRQWQIGKITTGAFREDKEDVIFDIRGPFGWYASISHFWNADDRANGDYSLTHFDLIGDYPNSFTKIKRYTDGQWFRWDNGYHERRFIEYSPANGWIYRFSYHPTGLIDFYKTRRIWHESYTNYLGQTFYPREMITMSPALCDIIIWEILGRMSHHIQDMCVPCHSRADVHYPILEQDCYHDYIDNGAYNLFNWQTAKNAGGFINPYEAGGDPIRYLMYTAVQLSDHYPSGPDCSEIPQQHPGDNNLPGGTYPMIDNYYQQLGSSPQNISDKYALGSKCFNHAIRATAGLFYWFAVETGIFSTDPMAVPVINGFTTNLPDNQIFRGENMHITCNASGSFLNYNWFVKVCSVNNFCILPIEGLNFQSNENMYSIFNNSFNRSWTCSHYDTLCNAGFFQNETENPLHFYVGVTVSNQFGQVTKFYGMNTPAELSPKDVLRPPPPPPFSGCPVFSTHLEDYYAYENNILNKSEFYVNLGRDIKDRIIIKHIPHLDTNDNTFSFAISELNADVDYFDKFEMIAVDHPENTELGVTESNDIVLYEKNSIQSPSHAEKSDTVVTKELAYDSMYYNSVHGKSTDKLVAHFEIPYSQINSSHPLNLINNSIDSFALIIDPHNTELDPVLPVVKDGAGFVSAYDYSGNYMDEFLFSRRQRRADIIVPLQIKENAADIFLKWKQDFAISYLVVGKIFYDAHNEYQLKLVSAENSVKGNILKSVQTRDRFYFVMDSSSFITMKFENLPVQIPQGYKREYVFECTGHYIKSNPDNSMQTQSVEAYSDSKENDFYLQINFPNPFNPKTTIQYSIPSTQHAALTIYNSIGKEVCSLFDEVKTKGKHSITFDGTNYPSGIYYYKLTSGKSKSVRKMILMK